MPSVTNLQRNTARCSERHHIELFLLNKAISKCFVWLSLVLFSMTPTSCLTAERIVDAGWVLLSSGFVFSERSVMGERLGVMCITITLLLYPTPLLILLAMARLNRLNPWTDWYIGACQRRCKELSLLLRCHCHYFIPPPLHSPFPTSHQGDRS